MRFTHPTWLFGVAPLAGVVLYLLWGRRRREPVPFLELWRDTIPTEPIHRRFAPPSIAVGLALIALLLAVLAAAGPVGRTSSLDDKTPLTVIVDRGLTMSARVASTTVYSEQVSLFSNELARTLNVSPDVDVITVPAPRSTNQTQRIPANELKMLIDETKPTAVDTREQVLRIVRQQLADSPGPVVVISDARLGIDDARLVQVSAPHTFRNVGITHIAVRSSPLVEAMLRLRNDSDARQAVVVIETGGSAVETVVDLPAKGEERDAFVDLPTLGGEISAGLKSQDDFTADDRAWLLVSGWPKVEAAGPVGDLQRLIETYRSVRLAGDSSQTVKVSDDVRAIGASAGVVVHSTPGSAGADMVRATRVMPHPITAAVTDWTSFDLPIGTNESAPKDWTPVLWAGDRVLVAVRETPARQVWVGMDTQRWSQLPQYVVFWSAAIDWAGRGSEVDPSEPLSKWTPDWRPVDADPEHEAGEWPGVYERPDGSRRVFVAAPAFAERIQSPPPWQPKLRAALDLYTARDGGRDLGPIMILLAIGCIAGAATTWRGVTHDVGTPAVRASQYAFHWPL